MHAVVFLNTHFKGMLREGSGRERDLSLGLFSKLLLLFSN